MLLTLVSLSAAMLFYLPFWLDASEFGGIPFDRQGMERVHGMWDGPLYITAAATLWDPNPHNPHYAWLEDHLQPSDYAERFPLYPLMIRALSPLFGYWNGALVINVAVSTANTLFLYAFLRRFGMLPAAAFWIALISIFWPPRGFLYRYVAMSEPLFILGVLGAAYFYKESRFTLCGLFGAIAVASRPNSAMVVAAFGLLALWRIGSALQQGLVPAARETRRLLGLTLMPLTLAAILWWHHYRFGDWLAAIHAHDFVRPQYDKLFPALTYFGIGEEGVAYLFLLVLAGILELSRRRQFDLVVLSLVFYVPVLFTRPEVNRFLLPIFPFVFSLAGERVLASRPVRIAVLLSIPLVYSYAWITLHNDGYQAPIAPLRALLP